MCILDLCVKLGIIFSTANCPTAPAARSSNSNSVVPSNVNQSFLLRDRCASIATKRVIDQVSALKRCTDYDLFEMRTD